jgi:FMN phosphatase YigB (HAD superfamily)
MNLLSRFRVVLLDMNSTFMFGEDRFGEDQDFFATYQSVGGTVLDQAKVTKLIRSTFESMAADYENPSMYDAFPQVREVMCYYAPELSERELSILDHVFGLHELGTVSGEYAEFLQTLAKTHRLGLVANIWCKKTLWLEELQKANVLHLFESTIFSSDYTCMKPSLQMYEMALKPFDIDKSEVIFMGDSLRCDIEGAKRAGLSTVWINPARNSHPAADFVVSDLLELA